MRMARRVAAAKAIMYIPKKIRRAHYNFQLREERSYESEFSQRELSDLLSVSGIYICHDPECGENGASCSSKGRCVISSYLEDVKWHE